MTPEQQTFTDLLKHFLVKTKHLSAKSPPDEIAMAKADLMVLHALTQREGFAFPREAFYELDQEIIDLVGQLVIGVFANVMPKE